MSWDWYGAYADAVVPQYEAADPATLHAWFQDLLPIHPAAVLNIGAGSGRDAAWLAGWVMTWSQQTSGARRHAAVMALAWRRVAPRRSEGGPEARSVASRAWQGLHEGVPFRF
jgi:protein-L-isoaspartate O-methyltransferase